MIFTGKIVGTEGSPTKAERMLSGQTVSIHYPERNSIGKVSVLVQTWLGDLVRIPTKYILFEGKETYDQYAVKLFN